jgi:8-oxo-dGTP pyrophosphatase MutT (NUDIX family)
MWRGRGSGFGKKRQGSVNGEGDPATAAMTMTREISAGGVVVREISGVWHVALIEPQKEGLARAKASNTKVSSKRVRRVLCLPKGVVDAGERADAAALREVREETGVVAEVVRKIVDIKYVYVRTWGDGERVFKIVSFYLMRYVSGNIGEVAEEMRIEVKRAVWVPLAEAGSQMAYSGERGVVEQARELVETSGICGIATKSIRS